MKIPLVITVLCLVVVLSGCGTITVKHEVAPIYLTVDINIKVQKELENFFAFEESRDLGAGSVKPKGTKGSGGVVVEPKGT